MYSQPKGRAGSSLFTPAEHVVISHWLGRTSLCTEAGHLTFAEAMGEGQFPTAPDYRQGSAAVASILLSAWQESLPQFSIPNGDGLVLARPLRPVPIRRALLPRPVFLFEIDWALTAPGCSWPCAYHCTYLPEYDRQVVTCSFDSEDACGAADVALGSFPPDWNLLSGGLEVIKASWSADRDRFEQQRWEAFLSAGLVSREVAERLADDVWCDHDEDEASEEGEL